MSDLPLFLSADDFDTMHVASSGRLVSVFGLEINKVNTDITIEAWAQRPNTLGNPIDDVEDYVNLQSLGTLIQMSEKEAEGLLVHLATILKYIISAPP